eukprot:GHVT01090552.1.p2 GENE.GHVT01090552.1~~GHVT01090552.1.p2  ORF type:complete len:117 (-),score=5.96 GHVT01090552.1:2022-2372(-)
MSTSSRHATKAHAMSATKAVRADMPCYIPSPSRQPLLLPESEHVRCIGVTLTTAPALPHSSPTSNLHTHAAMPFAINDCHFALQNTWNYSHRARFGLVRKLKLGHMPVERCESSSR